MAQRQQRKRRYATKDGVCGRCGLPIRRGDTISPGRAEFSHPACARLGVKMQAPRARYLVGNVTGQTCAGCGMTIEANDERTTVSTVPWHKECFRRR